MAKNLTQEQLRDYLDANGVSTRKDSDGDLFTVLPADSDFEHNVVVYYTISGNSVRVWGFATEFSVTEENMARVLFTINELNKTKTIPKGYLADDRIIAEQYYLLDEEVSDEYIKENVLKFTTAAIWKFFCGFNGL